MKNKSRFYWSLILIVLLTILAWSVIPYAIEHTDSIEAMFITVGGGAFLMTMVWFAIDNTIKWIKGE